MLSASTTTELPTTQVPSSSTADDARSASFAELPAELLSNIFLRVRRSFRSQQQPNQWIRVAHVSRYWRAVSMGTPMLWTEWSASLPEGEESVYEAARLSGKLLMKIWLTVNVSQTGDLVELLYALRRRLRWLSIKFTKTPEPYDGTGMLALPEAPFLRELRCWNTERYTGWMALSRLPFLSDDVSRLVRSDSHLPNFDRLHLTSQNVHDMSAAFRPTLRKLCIKACPCTPEVLLSALKSMPLLEVISVMTTLQDFDADGDVTSKVPVAAQVPRLRRLEMFGNHVRASAQFLYNFTVPPSATLRIEGQGYLSCPLYDAFLEKVSGESALGHATPVHTMHAKSKIETHPYLHTAHLDFWAGEPVETDQWQDPLKPPLPAGDPSHAFAPSRDPEAYNEANALSVLDQFTHSPKLSLLTSLRTLVVSQTLSPFSLSFEYSLEGCVFLNSLKTVESLYLEGCVLYHLYPYPHQRLETIDLPRLKLLSLRHVCFNSQKFGRKSGVLVWLRDTLVARRDLGGSISKLIISDAANFTVEDAESLKPLVADFLWDQRVQMVEE
ncbi:hypothetical protein EIP91_004874 [Steccherinum ochraceum]|uniref:F-box domain-containing protein n=1 Tax=Steccherinum ochraceum TaxID=92696 RepID=A0A4R0R827_9APHY|nr:hypothetical protein EIP91_004874 [Steccherinum ochraceum]